MRAWLLVLFLLVLGLAPVAEAGTADQVGATFGLLIQDVVGAFRPAEGLVVQVDGDRLYMDLAEKDGVQPGQEYSVFRKGDYFRHPINGRPLGRYEDILGYAQIVRVHPQYSEAIFVAEDGKAPPQPEDGVRITRGRIRVAVAPATDMTKANADLRRVPFMIAHALELTKRFQVADPSAVQELLLNQKTRSEELLVSPTGMISLVPGALSQPEAPVESLVSPEPIAAEPVEADEAAPATAPGRGRRRSRRGGRRRRRPSPAAGA